MFSLMVEQKGEKEHHPSTPQMDAQEGLNLFLRAPKLHSQDHSQEKLPHPGTVLQDISLLSSSPAGRTGGETTQSKHPTPTPSPSYGAKTKSSTSVVLKVIFSHSKRCDGSVP